VLVEAVVVVVVVISMCWQQCWSTGPVWVRHGFKRLTVQL